MDIGSYADMKAKCIGYKYWESNIKGLVEMERLNKANYDNEHGWAILLKYEDELKYTDDGLMEATMTPIYWNEKYKIVMRHMKRPNRDSLDKMGVLENVKRFQLYDLVSKDATALINENNVYEIIDLSKNPEHLFQKYDYDFWKKENKDVKFTYAWLYEHYHDDWAALQDNNGEIFVEPLYARTYENGNKTYTTNANLLNIAPFAIIKRNDMRVDAKRDLKKIGILENASNLFDEICKAVDECAYFESVKLTKRSLTFKIFGVGYEIKLAPLSDWDDVVKLNMLQLTKPETPVGEKPRPLPHNFGTIKTLYGVIYVIGKVTELYFKNEYGDRNNVQKLIWKNLVERNHIYKVECPMSFLQEFGDTRISKMRDVGMLERKEPLWLDPELVEPGMKALYGGTVGIPGKIVGVYHTSFLKKNPKIYYDIVNKLKEQNGTTGYANIDLQNFVNGYKVLMTRRDVMTRRDGTNDYIFGWYGDNVFKQPASNSIVVPYNEIWMKSDKLNKTNAISGVFESVETDYEVGDLVSQGDDQGDKTPEFEIIAIGDVEDLQKKYNCDNYWTHENGADRLKMIRSLYDGPWAVLKSLENNAEYHLQTADLLIDPLAADIPGEMTPYTIRMRKMNDDPRRMLNSIGVI